MNLLADSGNEYEYAELGKLLPTNQLSPMKSISNSPAAVNRCAQPRVNLQLKFRELGVLELPKRNLRMLRKLGDGVFGTVRSLAHLPNALILLHFKLN